MHIGFVKALIAILMFRKFACNTYRINSVQVLCSI